MARRRTSSRVFFPWERARGPLGLFGRGRVRLALLVVAALAFVVTVRRREESLASIRATRASITTAQRAVAAFRGDHAGGCPRALGDLVAGGYAPDVPVDAWGQPLRLTCPGRLDARGFEVTSDGPDGVPGGLDRVE
jgi:general secretion pathway protein G